MKVCGRKDQGHCLTFDPGTTISLQFLTFPQKAISQLQQPGCIAQSVGHLTRKSGVVGSKPVWQHTFVSPSAFSRRAVVSYWRKYVHEVLDKHLGGLSLPRKSVIRLTDCPDNHDLRCLPWT